MEMSAEDYKAFKAQHRPQASVKEMGERMKQPEEGVIPMERMVSASTEKFMAEHGADEKTAAVSGLAADLATGGLASKGVAMATKAVKKGIQLGQRTLGETMRASEIKKPQGAMKDARVFTAADDEKLIELTRKKVMAQNAARDAEHAHLQKRLGTEEGQFDQAAHDEQMLAKRREKTSQQAQNPHHEELGPNQNQTAQELDPFKRGISPPNKNWNPEQAAVDKARTDIAARQASQPTHMVTSNLEQMIDVDRRITEKHPGQLREVIDSVKKNGITQPIIVTIDSNTGRGYISDGNTRVAAARVLGIKDIPIKFETTDKPFTKAQNQRAKNMRGFGIDTSKMPKKSMDTKEELDYQKQKRLLGE
jgi:hypothetical protein